MWYLAPKLRWVEGLNAGRIELVRPCFNPAVGHSLSDRRGVPTDYGLSAVEKHHDPRVVASFERDGIRNPVFLWARWEHIYPRWGGSRVHFARSAGLSLNAIVADMGDVFSDYPELDPEEALEKIEKPPIGLVPNRIYWTGKEWDIETELWKRRPRDG